jgi:transposase
MRYHRGNSRHQQSFLSVDDQISKSNVIRIMDEICEDFCSGVTLEKGMKDTGRKAYHPVDLLKIFVYGYFNGISSSRKLERETARNIELQWLTSKIVPDHKTISDFRKDNLELVQGLFKYLINEFKEQGLLKGKSIAVDGTKVKAYASKELNIKSIKHKLEGIEGQVEKYLKDMDALDKAEDDVEELEKKKAELEKELEGLAEKKKAFQDLKDYLESLGENRVSLTDVDAKIMRGRYGSYWGFNVQSAVDTESHFITAIDVTNNQNDKGLLAPMVEASETTTGQKAEESLADGGYYKITELEELEKEGTECFVALNRTPSQVKDQAEGLKFTYNQQEDRYSCQEGSPLVYKRKKTVDGRLVKVYGGIKCNECHIRQRCTNAEQRTIQRSENQEWIDSFHKKMNSSQAKEKLVNRRSVAEHPFGTIKYYMGQIPLLLRSKKKVQTEMNLYAIGYNLKRYFNILATENEKSRKSLTRLAA